MISKANISRIRSLGIKKYRYRSGLFVAEGDKLVDAFLKSKKWTVKELYAKPGWIRKLSPGEKESAGLIQEVSYEELKKISFLKTPHNVLALVSLPETRKQPPVIKNQWILTLENIQDPGNLGTILRIAAWFGIRTVVCSEGSVDVFNPKVIQASMGALTVADIYYTDLPAWFGKIPEKTIPVYGTLLKGQNIFNKNIRKKGIILLGNESKGISEQLRPFIDEPVTIPGQPDAITLVNSLNLSAAAAIICGELLRKNHSK